MLQVFMRPDRHLRDGFNGGEEGGRHGWLAGWQLEVNRARAHDGWAVGEAELGEIHRKKECSLQREVGES